MEAGFQQDQFEIFLLDPRKCFCPQRDIVTVSLVNLLATGIVFFLLLFFFTFLHFENLPHLPLIRPPEQDISI